MIVVKILNSVKKTRNLREIYEKITRDNPSIESFCLGIDKTTGKYRNVTIDKKTGNPILKLSEFPIHSDASYVTLQKHGTILDRKNAFTILGMDSVIFECPKGFVGPTCQPKNICNSPSDDFRFKPITYDQFERLALYDYDGNGNNETRVMANKMKRLEIDDHLMNKQETQLTHPRMKFQCLPNNEYRLRVCPDNQILDSQLNCQIYDICQDSLNGYKHNLPINNTDPVLSSSDYYLCENNKSVLRHCPDNTIFSSSNNGCVSNSECFGKGLSAIYVDEHNYIQCRDDIGVRINCPNGVSENQSGVISCKMQKCQPLYLTHKDANLMYDYGEIYCENDTPREVLCDRAYEPKSYEFKWEETFDYTFKEWPKYMLDRTTHKCVPSNDSIIYSPIVRLAWSSAMSQAYPFDIRTFQYICPDKTQYRWDYYNQKVIPATDEWVDTGAPCQMGTRTPVWDTLQSYPIGGIDNRMPLLVGVAIEPNLPQLKGSYPWPHYDSNRNTYKCSYLRYLLFDLQIWQSESSTPPKGFRRVDCSKNDCSPNKIIPLVLQGYGVPKDLETMQYYTIAKGSFDTPIAKDTTIIDSIRCENSYLLNDTTKIVPICWQLLPDKVAECNIKGLKFSKYKVEYNGVEEGSSFCFLHITLSDNSQTILTYRSLKVIVNNKETTSIEFPYN